MTQRELQKLVKIWRTGTVTMQDLGTMFKISRERVRQLLAKARENDPTIPTHSKRRA